MREDRLRGHGPGAEEDQAQAGGEQRELELVAAHEAHLEAYGQDSDQHLERQEGRRQPRAQTKYERQPAENLHGRHHDRGDRGQRNAHLGHEPRGAAEAEDEELLRPVNDEDQPDGEPEGNQSPVLCPRVVVSVHSRSSRVWVPLAGQLPRGIIAARRAHVQSKLSGRPRARQPRPETWPQWARGDPSSLAPGRGDASYDDDRPDLCTYDPLTLAVDRRGKHSMK